MKQLIKKSLKFTKETQYLLYYCIAMFSLDFYLRFVSRTMKSYSCLYYIPNLFTVMWILIFALIIHVIKKRKAKRLLIALKGLFNLTEKDFILVNPRNSPYIISVIIKKSSFNELTDIQLFNSLKSNQAFDTIVKVEKTILLNGIKLNRKMLDFHGDRYEGWGVNELRGGKPYNPPIGWNGYGIRVWERYDYGDNTWLDYNNTPGEWSVAYHGFGSSLSGNSKFVISPDNNNLLNTIIRQEFKNNNDKYHQGKTVGEGVYMTQFPNVLEKYCSEYACQGKKYKIGFMCRVMPDKIRCPENNDDFWIINGTDNEVRPYRILIKEVV